MSNRELNNLAEHAQLASGNTHKVSALSPIDIESKIILVYF